MKNIDKSYLKILVQEQIAKGYNCTIAVKHIKKLGFTPSTIRNYYKAFKPKKK